MVFFVLEGKLLKTKQCDKLFGTKFKWSILMNPLTIFGLFAVTAMLTCYALEDRSCWYILGFAVSCALGSVYGFLQGAWPFGIVEFIWSFVALRRWYLKN